MLALVTLFGALLTATPPASAEPAFTSAYLVRGDSLELEDVCFESPIDIGWEALARRTFKKFPIDNPPKDQLRAHRREVGGSHFQYSAEVPESLKRRHFYLLTERGAQPIVPQRLRGSIRYSYYPPENPQPPVFYGQICLPIPKGLQDAGFVATSSVPVNWKKDPATLAYSGATPRIQLASGPAALPPPGTDAAATEVKTAYILSSPELGTQYLFVRRAVGCANVCCEFAYDLYRVKAGLPMVAWTAFGCDL